MNTDFFENNQLAEWTVLSSLNIPKTTSLIAVAERGYKEFCFIIKPSPGSRKTDIVSTKQIPDIEDMFFVSNNHVLVKFKYGKAVLCMSNGSVIDIKDDRLRGEFFECNNTGKINGQSVLENDIKYLSFWQREEDLLVMRFQDNAVVSFAAKVVDIKEKVKQSIKDGKILELEEEAQEIVPSKVYGKSHGNQAKIHPGASRTHFEKLASNFSVNTKLAKCNLIRTEGELIMIAASIQQSSRFIDIDGSESDEENEQSESGNERRMDYSIYEVQNEVRQDWSAFKSNKTATADFKLKVISFNCKTQDEQNALIEGTQFEIVSPYLVFRNRLSHRIKIIELPLEDMYLKTGKPNITFFSEEKQREIDLNKMLKGEKVEHIKFYGIPKSSYRLIKSQELTSTKLNFYSSLLQVVGRNVAIIYNLDLPIKGQESFTDESASWEEIDVIPSMGQFVDPETFVNTGFQPTVSMDDEDEISTFIRSKKIRTNEYNNLCFGQESLKYPEGRMPNYVKVSQGILYRTYTELGLLELKKINKSLQDKQIDKIDPMSILATFGGYSIFSIYSEEILVLEQIYKQLAEEEFEDEMNTAGQIVENSYLRRLIQILTQPQSTLCPKKSDEEEETKNWLQTCWSVLMRERKTEATASKGYNSILHKSVHYNHTRVRDCLMNITMLSKENTLNMFTDNLIELSILFETMSPTVNAFFENAFLQTEFCQSVSNADWSAGETLYIFGRNSQIINEQETNAEITGGYPGSGKGTGRQNRPILLQMLRIDWIFRSGKGFGGLVQTLAKAQSESVFSTQLVITLTENFWSEYKHAIEIYCLFPFIVYFLSTMIYFSYFLFQDFDTSQTWQLNGGEFLCRIVLIVLMVYFGAYELLQLFSKGLRYFFDFWNIFDCVSMILNTLMLINHLAQLQLLDKEQVIICSFVAMFIMWIKTAQWFRLFDKTSFYIRLVIETISGVKYFIFILIFTQSMFANIIYILDSNRLPEEKLFQVAFGNPIADAFLNQYLLSLGDWDTGTYSGSNNVIIWFIFVFATLFSCVVILNMLIAIMGDTFDAVTENSQQASLAEKVQILNDFIWVVSLGQKQNDKKYFFAASPSQLADDEGDSWEGKVGAIKSALEVGMNNQRQLFLSKLNKVQNQVEQSTGKVQGLSKQHHGLDLKVEGMKVMIEEKLTDFANYVNKREGQT